MRKTISAIGIVCLLLAVVQATAASVPESEPLQLALVAPLDDDHFVRAAARRLQQLAGENGLDIVVQTAAMAEAPESIPDLFVMPVRSLATQVAALQVLELPFFYSSLEAVHQAVDGDLGAFLASEARVRGWEIAAYWDEGMHVLSGLKRYDRVRNLKIREFLVTRPDPVAEKQFQYWKAYTRRIDPQDRQAVLRECLIASRAATLQQIVREELFRVHLAISLSSHRFEGWVVVAPHERWTRLDEQTKNKLKAALRKTTNWQREDARRREAAALAELQSVGMIVYQLDGAQREAFRKALPDWTELLPDALDAQTKKELIRLASAGTATAVRAGGTAAVDTRGNASPGAPAR